MQLAGRITNINSTKYTVDYKNTSYECVLRGIFRNLKITPCVGDIVLFDKDLLTIEQVKERINCLDRPNVANVDYALILVSVKEPNLDLTLLDKLLVNIISSDIKPIICFSKIDLLNNKELNDFKKVFNYYQSIGIKTITNNEIDKFNKLVKNKVIVTTGQTGSGKSTFINKLDNTLNLKTSKISDALGRGVHTTRYVTLYKINDYYIVDTPGFSSLDLTKLDKQIIRDSFIEFHNYECKYRDCMHINTDGCSIINNPNILPSRYENYVKFIKEKNESIS